MLVIETANEAALSNVLPEYLDSNAISTTTSGDSLWGMRTERSAAHVTLAAFCTTRTVPSTGFWGVCQTLANLHARAQSAPRTLCPGIYLAHHPGQHSDGMAPALGASVEGWQATHGALT